MTTPSSDKNEPLSPGKLPGNLLQRFIETYGTPHDDRVTVGPGYGRDAAAISFGDETLVVKSDPITFASDAAAKYLVAVNANDVACLGGVPRWLSVVALLPESATSEETVEQLFAELHAACVDAGVSIIGGHTEVTLGLDRPLLIGTMLGTAGHAGLIKPGGAQVGEALMLSKWAAIEGTALIARERADELIDALGADLVRAAAKLLRSPGISIVRDAAAVTSVTGVTALHDPTEGGVATAIHELTATAGVGAEVLEAAIPVLPETRAICEHLGIDPLGTLSSGALLFTVSPERQHDVERAAAEHGVPVTRIGEIVRPDEDVTIVRKGAKGRESLPIFDADEITRVL